MKRLFFVLILMLLPLSGFSISEAVDELTVQTSITFPDGSVQTTAYPIAYFNISTSLVFRGEWSAAILYNTNDYVAYNGNIAAVLTNNISTLGQPPSTNTDGVVTNSAYWTVLVEKGARGPPGTNGVTLTQVVMRIVSSSTNFVGWTSNSANNTIAYWDYCLTNYPSFVTNDVTITQQVFAAVSASSNFLAWLSNSSNGRISYWQGCLTNGGSGGGSGGTYIINITNVIDSTVNNTNTFNIFNSNSISASLVLTNYQTTYLTNNINIGGVSVLELGNTYITNIVSITNRISNTVNTTISTTNIISGITVTNILFSTNTVSVSVTNQSSATVTNLVTVTQPSNTINFYNSSDEFGPISINGLTTGAVDFVVNPSWTSPTITTSANQLVINAGLPNGDSGTNQYLYWNGTHWTNKTYFEIEGINGNASWKFISYADNQWGFTNDQVGAWVYNLSWTNNGWKKDTEGIVAVGLFIEPYYEYTNQAGGIDRQAEFHFDVVPTNGDPNAYLPSTALSRMFQMNYFYPGSYTYTNGGKEISMSVDNFSISNVTAVGLAQFYGTRFFEPIRGYIQTGGAGVTNLLATLAGVIDATPFGGSVITNVAIQMYGGTNDGFYNIRFMAYGAEGQTWERARIDGNGLSVSNSLKTPKIIFEDNRTQTTAFVWTDVPAATNSAGKAGDMAKTNDFLYICVEDNNWKRAALSGW